MRSLPESLLLLALDDRKGVVVSGAFLAIDHGLRGACLAELRGRGVVRTRGGEIARTERPLAPTGSPTLDRVAQSIEGRGSVDERLTTLAAALPRIRADLVAELEERGVLQRASLSGGGLLPEMTTFPLADPRAVQDLRDEVVAAVRRGDDIGPREGTLAALAIACNLDRVIFPADLRAEARRVADFVASRDSVVRGVRAAVQRAEGNE